MSRPDDRPPRIDARLDTRLNRRLDPRLLAGDPRIASGHFTDEYFNRTRQILMAEGRHPIVRWQVFQKREARVCGLDEAIGIVRFALGDDWRRLSVSALRDGDSIAPHETVLLVEGDLSLFIHLETIVLGTLARRTRIATNVYGAVRAACLVSPKPVLFFPARFDIYSTQAGDGYAFDIAARRGLRDAGWGENSATAATLGGVSTAAQGEWTGAEALGTIPHALEAAYGGDVARATLAFAERIDPRVPRIALVDYHNDSVATTLEVAEAMLARFREARDERFRLRGVRLDTSEALVDRAFAQDETVAQDAPASPERGVTPALVHAVHGALAERAASHAAGSLDREFYEGVGIIVSGGFTPEKIHAFESARVPVSAYGVGSAMFAGRYDFTADVVGLQVDGVWRDEAKVGRHFRPNERLKPLDSS